MGQKRTEESHADRWAGKPDVCVMSDAVAEALEAAGLYRRAARRWLEVLDRCRDCDERAWLATRRSQCLEKARKSEPKAEYLGEVCQAASDTQKRWAFGHRKRSGSIPLLVTPVKSCHADYCGTVDVR